MLYPRSYGKNPFYPKSSDFSVIKKDRQNGFGVISHKYFKPQELLAHVSGEIVSTIGQHTLQISPEKHLYDPYFTGYLLHSCSPNVSLDMEKLTLTAIKEIQMNSFLFMDYAETEDKLFKQFICSCGSPNCRGVITGRNETPHIYLNTTPAFTYMKG
ncbi:MAG: SET domain-containing protein-lysine N-methyltransferase [Bdellovibrionaceae bacterium]|nr:SET domain-containing protein-lysine N-methyltransferase [Pseudobdellovibrionaceae bacterium]